MVKVFTERAANQQPVAPADPGGPGKVKNKRSWGGWRRGTAPREACKQPQPASRSGGEIRQAQQDSQIHASVFSFSPPPPLCFSNPLEVSTFSHDRWNLFLLCLFILDPPSTCTRVGSILLTEAKQCLCHTVVLGWWIVLNCIICIRCKTPHPHQHTSRR